MTARSLTGFGLIAFAVYFNVPFSLLSGMFEYPDILRHPAAEILEKFAAGGPALIAVWYLFALAGIAFIPVALALRNVVTTRDGKPSNAIATFGVLAGLVQAFGLIRWVFVVPVLAAIQVDPAATAGAKDAAQVAFTILHQYAGVALGEHLGQLFTVIWVGALGFTQLRNGARITGSLGLAAAALIFAGLADGFATVMPIDIGLLGKASIFGFMALTAWLIATGIGMIRQGRAATQTVVLAA